MKPGDGWNSRDPVVRAVNRGCGVLLGCAAIAAVFGVVLIVAVITFTVRWAIQR